MCIKAVRTDESYRLEQSQKRGMGRTCGYQGMVQAGSPAIDEDGKSVMRTDLYKAMKIAANVIRFLCYAKIFILVQRAE